MDRILRKDNAHNCRGIEDFAGKKIRLIEKIVKIMEDKRTTEKQKSSKETE